MYDFLLDFFFLLWIKVVNFFFFFFYLRVLSRYATLLVNRSDCPLDYVVGLELITKDDEARVVSYMFGMFLMSLVPQSTLLAQLT